MDSGLGDRESCSVCSGKGEKSGTVLHHLDWSLLFCSGCRPDTSMLLAPQWSQLPDEHNNTAIIRTLHKETTQLSFLQYSHHLSAAKLSQRHPSTQDQENQLQRAQSQLVRTFCRRFQTTPVLILSVRSSTCGQPLQFNTESFPWMFSECRCEEGSGHTCGCISPYKR